MATAAEKKTAAEKTARDNAKAEKFVTLAEKRVTKAINAVRSVRKLASPNYIATQEQVDRIAEVLREEVVEMHAAFGAKGAPAKETFKL